MNRNLSQALLTIAALTLLAAAPARANSATAPALTPALSVMTLAGEDIDLARLRGHVVVLHFWATWCTPCIEEMPALEKFYQAYRARGVEVLALSQDRTRDIDAVHQMMHHMRMSYPVAMLHNASRNSLGEQKQLPVTYVLDAAGAVRATLRPDADPLTTARLGAIVDPLLPAP